MLILTLVILIDVTNWNMGVWVHKKMTLARLFLEALLYYQAIILELILKSGATLLYAV